VVMIVIVGGATGKVQELLTKPFQTGLGLQTDCQTWATQKCASNKVPQSVKDSIGSVPDCKYSCDDNGNNFPCMCGETKITDNTLKFCCYTQKTSYNKKMDCEGTCGDESVGPDSLTSGGQIRAYMYSCWQSAGEGSVARRLLQTNCNFYP
jgi:hypothetical protein